jgi:FkbM family methyltransferase
MRIKFNKEIEFIFKKIFFSEKYLLKKRLNRAIKKVYEEELLILDKVVDKNLESVDVGVYRGVYTYQLSKISKHVHAFEPNPLLYSYLNKNLKKLAENITLYENALSNVNITTDLKIPKRFKTLNKKNYEEMYKLGAATIHEKNLLNNEDFITFKIKTKKLDDVLNNNNVGFIKIDVEGHEENVLNGAIKILKRDKPVLLVEIEERHSKKKVEETINFINSLGYKSYYLSGSNLENTNKLKNYKEKNNYFFIK